MRTKEDTKNTRARRIFKIWKFVPNRISKEDEFAITRDLSCFRSKVCKLWVPRWFTDSQNWLREIVWQQRESIFQPPRKIFCSPSYFCQRRKKVHCQKLHPRGERTICSVLFCSVLHETFRKLSRSFKRERFKHPSLLKRSASINFASVNYKQVCTPSRLWFIKTDSFLRGALPTPVSRSSSRWIKEPGQLCCLCTLFNFLLASCVTCCICSWCTFVEIEGTLACYSLQHRCRIH